jgi:hypothetical protein
MRNAICTLSILGLAACGAAGPRATDAPKARAESIGDVAGAQGGLSSLGAAGNHDDGATGVEIAFGGALRADDVDPKSPVKLDGLLREWPPRAVARESQAGKTADLALGVAVQMDEAKLYVAAEVTDPGLARTARHGPADDHVSMTLAFPSGRGGLRAYAVGLFPGKPGESSGSVRWLAGPSKGQEVPGARLVEADGAGGFTAEASIPWSAFAEARTMRVGLRASLRYHDGDGANVRGVLGTGPGSVERPQDLPALLTAAEQSVVEGLLGPKNLAGTAPRIDVFADVAGDEKRERVSVFGKLFTICGPGYRGGRQFFWREIEGELTSLEARDVTGRGKDDLIVRRRLTSGGVRHELLEIWTAAVSDEPTTIFSAEIAVVDVPGGRRVTNAVRVSAGEVEVTVEPAVGWDAASFREPVLPDDQGLLLPWGPVRSRTFRLDKGRFAKTHEVAQPPASASSGSVTQPKDLPSPAGKRESDLGARVLEAYLRDQGKAPSTRPRFDLEVNVDEDRRPERVALVGRDVVVMGPGFKGGSGYARMSLTQFAEDKDVSELSARDVTGDGAAELIVRGVRHVKAPSGETVDVEGLFLYQVKGGVVGRVFAVETGREEAGKRVQGLVQFVPARSGKGFDVDVRPGSARGWTDKTYPWPQERPGGAMEPLLLPWGGVPSLRYAWNGAQFAIP